MDAGNRYVTDVSDAVWARRVRVIPAPKPGGRPAQYARREIVNARLYVTRTGCRWRMLPKDFPPWVNRPLVLHAVEKRRYDPPAS